MADRDLVGWQTTEVTLEKEVVIFVIEGVKGGASYGDNAGDIALDNFLVIDGFCLPHCK